MDLSCGQQIDGMTTTTVLYCVRTVLFQESGGLVIYHAGMDANVGRHSSSRNVFPSPPTICQFHLFTYNRESVATITIITQPNPTPTEINQSLYHDYITTMTYPSTEFAALEQEQPAFCILHHPRESFVQIGAGNRAAPYNMPLVCLDGVELEPLHHPVSRVRHAFPHSAAFSQRHPLEPQLTSRISSGAIHPSTSVLLAKTSRQAPESRCRLS